MSRFLSAVLSLCSLLTLSSWANEDSCLHRTVSLTVADRDGARIADLKPADFQGEFRGKAVKILSIVPDDHPHRIVVILDASGSIEPSPMSRLPANWTLASLMAWHLAESISQRSSLALLIFNDKIREQIGFSQDAQAVRERLRQIVGDTSYAKTMVKGKTALIDAMVAGFGLVQDPNSGDSFYLITDGGENASRARLIDVRHRLAASSSRVFVSLIASLPERGYRRHLMPGELSGPEEMTALAHATGGALFGPVLQARTGTLLLREDFKKNLTLSTGLVQFYQTILGGYRMEVELPNEVEKWREWKLEFSKGKQSPFKEYQLGYTRDLGPCSEQQ